ncbi:acyltransferase family protein [Nocardioides ginsengisoli]|uniref:Acyltransferase family protein n=1 Tax=Nocardioides ginsengisoli TaxID=363868 RepID=A0ABW3VU68_9ACTN
MGTFSVGARRRAAPVRSWRDHSIGEVFDPRRNALNLVRLGLALLVLVAHSFTLSGNGYGFTFNGDHLGTWAVFCFFCLSGYLITGSRVRTRFMEYLSHRIGRIYPGFLVSLIVVTFGFAPIAYLKENGSLNGFLTTAPQPLHALVSNLGLSMREWGVAGTLADNPYPLAWNGSLWSLYYEFLCYLSIGALLSIALLRRRPQLLLPLFGLSVLAVAHTSTTLGYFGGNGEVARLVPLLPFFLGGAVVYAFQDVIPLTWWSAIPAFAGFVALVRLDGVWGPGAAAPLLTLALLWLGKVLPCPGLLRRHDISFGTYVYAFPSQQLVAALGGTAWGPYVHAALALPSTLALATASWLLIERPAMNAARGRHRPAAEPEPAPIGVPSATGARAEILA